MIKKLFFLAIAALGLLFCGPLSSSPALAAGGSDFRASVEAGYMSEADINDDRGKVSWTSYGVKVGYSYFTVGYTRYDFDWTDVGRLPFGNGVDDPWDALQRVSLSARYNGRINDKWGYNLFGGIGAEYEKEIGPLNYGASAVFDYAISPRLSASIGGIFRYNEVKSYAFPVVGVSYNRGPGNRSAEGFSASLGFPRTDVAYRFNPAVAARLALNYDSGIFRLADDSTVQKEGYVETTGWGGGIFLDLSPWQALDISAGITYSAGREFTIYNSNEDKLSDYSLDPALGYSLSVGYRF